MKEFIFGFISAILVVIICERYKAQREHERLTHYYDVTMSYTNKATNFVVDKIEETVADTTNEKLNIIFDK